MREIIDVVDEKDNFIRKTSRKEVREKALLHRTCRVVIVNEEHKLIVHKRSKSKDIYPNHFDIGMAETVKSGESYEAAAVRGLKEEFGIFNISNIQLMRSFLFKINYRSKKHNIICKVYKLSYKGKLKLQEEEVEDAKFLTIEEVKRLMNKMPFHPVGKIVFDRYLELKS